MKILGINIDTQWIQGFDHEIIGSTLKDSNPFGYDLILVRADSPTSIYGTNNRHDLIDKRWDEYLERWLVNGHKIIVFMNNMKWNSLSWIKELESIRMNFETAGSSDYIGNIYSLDAAFREFMQRYEKDFHVETFLKATGTDKNMMPGSGIDASLLTSFVYKVNDTEIIFIPSTSVAYLNNYINSLSNTSTYWKTPDLINYEKELSVIHQQIDELNVKKDKLATSVEKESKKVDEAISGDIYAQRAVDYFKAAVNSSSPDPELYYGVIESIEKAFTSEREMRDTLDIRKNYIGKVTRRANEFRHVAKSGEHPEPLSSEEIQDFNARAEKIIGNYVNYLLGIGLVGANNNEDNTGQNKPSDNSDN